MRTTNLFKQLLPSFSAIATKAAEPSALLGKVGGRLLLLFFILTTSMTASAYDFSAVNEQGQTIYYNITDATARTVEVTYRANPLSFGNQDYDGMDVVIPSQVTYNGGTYTVIGFSEYAFGRSGLTSISFPSTIKYIKKAAFTNCKHISSITIPDNVTSIGEYNQEIEGVTNVEIISVSA